MELVGFIYLGSPLS